MIGCLIQIFVLVVLVALGFVFMGYLGAIIGLIIGLIIIAKLNSI